MDITLRLDVREAEGAEQAMKMLLVSIYTRPHVQ